MKALIVVSLLVGGCSYQDIKADDVLIEGLAGCKVSMQDISAHPGHKDLYSTTRNNYKRYQRSKRMAKRYDPESLQRHKTAINECETVISGYFATVEKQKSEIKAAKKQRQLAQKKANQERIIQKFKSKGYDNVHFTGISQFLAKSSNQPEHLNSMQNHVFMLKNTDGMFKVSQVLSDTVVYTVDTDDVQYKFEDILYPYARTLSSTVLFTLKKPGKLYFVGQKLGVNSASKAYVFRGLSEYVTFSGNNTAFVFKGL